MKIKKKLILLIAILGIIFSMFLINTPKVFASNTIYISLSDEKITINNNNITEDNTQDIYLSNSMDNGGSSTDAIEANKEIENIINISKSGTYEFTGKLSDGQISINTNNINGDVIIILNNVDITCENAPAIFVFNKETKSSTCNVIIKTAKDSENTISGGKIKQSVEGWSDQENLVYSVEKNYNDEGEYFERYKYDGAISSDISLTFEGEGTLIVNSLSKEGIETKRDITINSGNYVINSLDDGMNAAADGESIITINGGNVLVNVTSEAEEGDAIDSNGYLYINGGTIYAFACESSEDSGLDSDLGIYINGGIVVATGNMSDAVSKESKQKFLQLQFKTKVSKDTLITITDQNKSPITAFKADREYTILTISMPNITDEGFYVYEGGTIKGTNENGLYTEITSYTEGTEKEYNTVSDMGRPENFERNFGNINTSNQSNKIYIYIIVILSVILVVLIIVAIALKKKGKIMILFIGILTGAILATIGFMIYTNVTKQEPILTNEQMQNNGQQMPGGQMQREEKPDGQMPQEGIPEKPDNEGNMKKEEIPEKPTGEEI